MDVGGTAVTAGVLRPMFACCCTRPHFMQKLQPSLWVVPHLEHNIASLAIIMIMAPWRKHTGTKR